MTTFNALNLSGLPAPDVVAVPDYEETLVERKAKLVELYPPIEEFINIEGDPDVKVQESAAYREMIIYARVNDAARAVMLAFAQGSDLDHLAAFYNVQRQEGELDERFRTRVQLAPEGFRGAGPEGGIVFHAMSASVDVRHVSLLVEENMGVVHISILSETGDGTVSDETYEAVHSVLNDKYIKNATDVLKVQRANITPYAVDVTLHIYEGPDASLVSGEALKRLEALTKERHKIGRPVHRNALIGAASVAGVENVTLNNFTADLEPEWNEALYASEINIAIEVMQ